MRQNGYTALLMCLLTSIFLQVRAQELSNLRERVISVAEDTVQLDTLSIIPGSMIMETTAGDRIVPVSDYRLIEAEALLIWLKKPPKDSIRLSYRVFPYGFTRPQFHIDYEKVLQEQEETANPFIFYTDRDAESFWDFGTLNYNGSFSRGISFGNNQDLIHNADFNLQLSGYLADNIEVTAAITDNNVPLQPEGNTQQIQEFDKVFIQLRKGDHRLIAGDYEIQNPNSYFMSFFKKTKGLSYRSKFGVWDKGMMQLETNLAFARGQFARNAFTGKEGNQGPYKLTGNKGETFIVVLAGTERVYIDGQLMERGADRDYIINYNTAELTFMPRQLITKDKRITVEFEYSNQNYSRSLLHVKDEFKSDKLEVRFNLYSEQDGKNQPIQRVLNGDQKRFLSTVGDSIQQALYTGVRQDTFDGNRIMYKKIDTTVNAILYTDVYVHSTDPDSAQYVLSFTNVGQGNGDYRRASSLANGVVYEWVAPDSNGQRQGAYLPVILLVTPQRQQMVTLGVDYAFSERNKLTTELAVSNRDVNTFSKQDDKDDKGFSGKIGYENKLPFGKEKKDPLTLTTTLNYEFIHSRFRPLERFRNVEFDRDWNLSANKQQQDEHIGKVGIGLSKADLGNWNYGFSTFVRGTGYEGYQHSMNTRLRKKGFQIALWGSYLSSESLSSRSRFFRPRFDVSKAFASLNGWKVGLKGEREDNRVYPLQADTLMPKSFKYDTWQVYIANADTATNRFGIDYTERYDRFSVREDFRLSTVARSFNLNGALIEKAEHQLRWRVTYRKLEISDSSSTTQQPDESVLGRVEYSFVLGKGLLRSGTLYELGTGQEQKRQYSYLRVNAGEGTYIWNDYDSSGTQELNEFELSPFADEADFIRILVPTNEFVQSNLVNFNQSLSLSPKALWYDASGFKKALSLFSTLSVLQIERKTFDVGDVFPLNPFELEVVDTQLISVNSIIRNTLYFNRSSAKFSMELNWQTSSNKVLLVNGFESRKREETGSKLRWNISRKFTTNIEYKQGSRFNDSELATNKNYNIQFHEVEPRLTFLSQNTFRISVLYNYLISNNEPALGGERALNNEIGTDLRYNVLSKSTLSASFSYVSVDYEGGKANTPVAFALLNGLRPGNNFLWRLALEKRLADNIQMSIGYEGRKTGDNAIVHVGRAQVRAIF